MDVNGIRAKTVRCGIRRGMSVADFCEKYECSEEDFRRRLKLIFKHETDSVLKEICEAAEKQRRKPSNGQPSMDDKPAVAIAVVEVSFEDDSQEVTARETVVDEIHRLKEEESAQSAIVMDLENQHKALRGSHRDKIKELRDIQDNLDQIKVKFQKYAARFEQIVGENNDIVEKMNEISAKRRQEKVTLDIIRSKIRELETVTIFVYDNGTIAPLDETLNIKLDDTGFEAVLSDLMMTDSCQDLKVKDIQTIARLKCIIKNSPVELEVIFENDDVELACLMLRDEGKF